MNYCDCDCGRSNVYRSMLNVIKDMSPAERKEVLGGEYPKNRLSYLLDKQFSIFVFSMVILLMVFAVFVVLSFFK